MEDATLMLREFGLQSLNPASATYQWRVMGGRLFPPSLSFSIWKIRMRIFASKGSCRGKVYVEHVTTADGAYFRTPRSVGRSR